MKTILASVLLSMLATTVALAQPAPGNDCTAPCTLMPPTAPAPAPAVAPPPVAVQPTLTAMAPQPAAPPTQLDEDTGWSRPAGQRFTSGFRLGWMYISNYETKNRLQDDGTMKSLKDEFGLKNPNMFLIGYEGFYRIVGHSWLNVLMVGNVSVAGLDQSKFIPTGSGLLGFEIDRSFELGVGVNLTPDPKNPSHMIAAAGWTPKVGSIQTPVHAFWIPDADGNTRYGATIGMNW